jgi:simple sugar transport system ATP-binding protein
MPAPPILAAEGLSRRYGAVAALEDVSFSVAAGEALAVCGDNGAGKSTLIKILSGAQPPSAGRLTLNGEPAAFRSPGEALARGVATIYQDLALAPRFPVYRNVFLGSELGRPTLVPGLKLLDERRMREEARAHLARLRVSIDVDRPVNALSGGQRQAVAIARALRWRASIVIMDEPTAALGVRETRQVLDLVHEIRDQGITVILVSHNMRDVVEVCGRALILRGGRLDRDLPLAGVSADALAHEVMERPLAREPRARPLSALETAR